MRAAQGAAPTVKRRTSSNLQSLAVCIKKRRGGISCRPQNEQFRRTHVEFFRDDPRCGRHKVPPLQSSGGPVLICKVLLYASKSVGAASHAARKTSRYHERMLNFFETVRHAGGTRCRPHRTDKSRTYSIYKARCHSLQNIGGPIYMFICKALL